MQNGKGDKPRISNYRRYWDNFDFIKSSRKSKGEEEKVVEKNKSRKR